MIEKHTIHNKDVWVKIDPHPIERENPNIFPNEYFTASYYLQDPADAMSIGVLIKDEADKVAMFESPVAALNYAVKNLNEALK